MVEDDKIWIGQDGQQFGPYSESDIRQWLAEGKLGANAMAWRAGMTDWVSLSSLFPGLAAAGEKRAPPPLPNPSRAPFGPATTAGVYASAGAAPFSSQRPGPVESLNKDRRDIPTPPALHWGLVVLFSVLTFGIFAIVWQFIQSNWVKKIDSDSHATPILAVATAFLIAQKIVFAMQVFGDHSSGTQRANLLLLLVYLILTVAAYFSMRRSIQDKLANRGLPLNIGGATLFFFSGLYLQAQLTWIARWKHTGQTTPRASKGIFWVLLGAIFVLAILAAVMVPAYQQYLARINASS